ncbi:hypothetical protein F0L74_22915 [Chitinophaga agrisoli]|uniref:DSBA-like thioredoxin domain-containing protein n=1 Tax=Chitinophaga agrisoli TaxID=2607653 RepID=A0A5B2VKL9_9BACT|nr:DsbA family protein [Chitinophaga agrisoli]KAA2239066.1 hypothetical protein F0L74_22915 [Chitinophaga agrisoli]
MSNGNDVPTDGTCAADNACQLPAADQRSFQLTDNNTGNALNQSIPALAEVKEGSNLVLHWYDLTCPFCYLGQKRNEYLISQGLTVIELPFQAHPDIPAAGVYMGPRKGPMYTTIEQQAAETGLPLHWQDKLPNSRKALMAAEWARQHQPAAFPSFLHDLFNAHFAAGRDIGDADTILGIAVANGIDTAPLQQVWADGNGEAAVSASEALAVNAGVRGTPAWFMAGQLIPGLQPLALFEQLAAAARKS